MDKLNIGMDVCIMRSDGRVHEALITEIHHSSNSVGVEWFEQGETKAKHIALEALMKSNPKIFHLNHHKGSAVAPQSQQQPSSNKATNPPQTAMTSRSRHSVASTQPKHLPEPIAVSAAQPVPEVVANHKPPAPSLPPIQNHIDKLCIGMQVDIERSDGRVHSALITQLIYEKNAANVEWYEKGETKGKEIDVKALVRHNPTIFKSSPSSLMNTSMASSATYAISNAPNAARASGAQTARARHSVAAQPQHSQSMLANATLPTNGDNVKKATANVEKKKTVLSQPPPTTATTAAGRNGVRTNGLDKDKRRTHLVKHEPKKSSRVTQVISSKMPEVLPEMDEDFEEEAEEVVLETPEKEQPQEAEEEDDVLFLFEAPVAQNENELIIDEPTAQPSNQKSQLLENIKELERNREQRRALQDQARKQREMQMQIDPGNPNWEFLSMIRDYQAQLVYRPLKMSDQVVDNRICVCVRKRPLSKKELANKEVEVITIPNKDNVVVHQPQVKVDLTKYLVNQKFRFDYAFNESTSNEMVYKFSAQPLVRTIFQRGFATCFAYGQTGSGKTHTMGGVIEGRHQDCTNGVYALTAQDVFSLLNSPEYRDQNLSVSCSFFEIYGTKVFDLLSKKAKLRILEDGKKLVQVVGLKEVKVYSVDEVLKLIRVGSNQRTAGQTSANSNSSRSHAVFQIILRRWEKNTDMLYGKFSLIDLAGNERGADTISSDRQTRLESSEINKSLLALKECIRAMGRDEQHIPFRGSKLTLILRDSFVGRNAKTCMIAMVSPGISSVENSMNTLRYADRVKELGGGNDRDELLAEEEVDDQLMWERGGY